MSTYRNKRVRIVDVAELAGVSVATVSRVLNGKDEHISEETCRKVRQSAEDLDYVPNEMARRLKEQNSKTLGLVIPGIGNAFQEMAEGAEEEASARGYSMFLCNTRYNVVQEEKSIRMLESKMVEGILFVSSNHESNERLINSLQIPCVALSRNFPRGENIGLVHIDNYQAMIDVARYLVRKGCRKLCYITSDIHKSPARERYQGLVDGLKALDIEFNNKLLYADSYSVETGFVGTMSLLGREPDIDCIICGNDIIAIGALNVCQKMKKRIPEDIRIMGFDDTYISKYLNPELTTVRQNAHDLGRQAVKMLIDHVENNKPLSDLTLKHEIVERATI